MTVQPHSRITIGATESGHAVSPTLFGLFLEDINFALDGGLNANLVGNYSFDDVYLDPRRSNVFATLIAHRRVQRRAEPMRRWSPDHDDFQVRPHDDPRRGNYVHTSTQSGLALLNHGPVGEEPSIGARRGVELTLSVLARSTSTEPLVAALVTPSGQSIAEATTQPLSSDWTRVEATLLPEKDAIVSLRLVLPAGGVDIDDVRLIPNDSWGIGDPRWSQGLLRRDLVEAIRDVHPRFLRFPGGCVVEGMDMTNAYNWKNTVGPLETRIGDYNLWGLNRSDRGYAQSHQIGFYEMFLLCEDLGMVPLPVINAGIACQMRSNDRPAVGSPQWKGIVRDVIDLIDWATGKPETNPWAALRAEAGHPEPFPLEIIGIGNENFGAEYLKRFDLIVEAVEQHRPGLRFVLSGGTQPRGRSFDLAWEHARDYGDRVVVDEHFYMTPKWFLNAATRYDAYPRGGAQVFAGEYAARLPLDILPQPIRPVPNTWHSALAEAAFYTGIIRNSDVVTLSSYAPLLNRVGESQWGHNFIDFNAFTVSPTLNYRVQQLFTSALGSRTLGISVVGEGLFASATADDALVNVHLVNTTDETQQVTVQLPDDLSLASAFARTRMEGELTDTLPLSPEAHEAMPLTRHVDEVVRDGKSLDLTLPPRSITRLIGSVLAESATPATAKLTKPTAGRRPRSTKPSLEEVSRVSKK